MSLTSNSSASTNASLSVLIVNPINWEHRLGRRRPILRRTPLSIGPAGLSTTNGKSFCPLFSTLIRKV